MCPKLLSHTKLSGLRDILSIPGLALQPHILTTTTGSLSARLFPLLSENTNSSKQGILLCVPSLSLQEFPGVIQVTDFSML